MQWPGTTRCTLRLPSVALRYGNTGTDYFEQVCAARPRRLAGIIASVDHILRLCVVCMSRRAYVDMHYE
eukprot:6180953-Pleurochrysis_carterae.AAC.1